MGTEILGKLRRLPAMDGSEIRYRLNEALRRGLESASLLAGAHEESDEELLARLPPRPRESAEPAFAGYLRHALGRRFYLPAGGEERRALVEAMAGALPDLRSSAVAAAERACSHRFQVLGCGEVDLGAEIDWHRDPISGETWERRPWPSYDLVHEHRAGDPKRVLELNRHQHLPRLGEAYWLTGDERFAREAVAQILSWIEQNPAGIGVHWHSSLELAFRAVAWLWTLGFVAGSPALDEPSARRIGKSLFAQLEHVHAYPSLYTSPNTHLLGEAAALYLGGLVFRDLELGRRWLDRGAELLERELDRQFGNDGVHAELSTWYHAYATDLYLQVIALAERNGRRLDERSRARVESMLDFLLEISRADGGMPLLGDDDGGRALPLGAPHYLDVRGLLSTGAVLFGRAELKRRARRFHAESWWQLGAEGGARFATLPEVATEPQRTWFPEAGYYVLRSGRAGGDGHLVFDCGGLGRLGGAHGHADALAITLHAHGRDLLVDPGTFVYNGEPAWRDYFRSTRAHNTVTVDGFDQSEPGDTFRWKRPLESRLLGAASFDEVDYLAGEHDGYDRPPLRIRHRRRVLFARPEYWLVIDEFRGQGRHEFDLLYHLAPGCELSAPEYGLDRREARLIARAGRAGLQISLHASVPLELREISGDCTPPQGWVSRRYGEKTPAPVVAARLCAEAPLTVTTLLAPFEAGASGLASVPELAARNLAFFRPHAASGRGALAIGVARGRREDVAVVSLDGSEVQVGSCRARGELCWARFVDGDLRRLLAVDADRFVCRGEERLGGAREIAWREFDVRRASVLDADLREELLGVRHRGSA